MEAARCVHGGARLKLWCAVYLLPSPARRGIAAAVFSSLAANSFLCLMRWYRREGRYDDFFSAESEIIMPRRHLQSRYFACIMCDKMFLPDVFTLCWRQGLAYYHACHLTNKSHYEVTLLAAHFSRRIYIYITDAAPKMQMLYAANTWNCGAEEIWR